MVFWRRLAQMVSLKRMQHLRVVGSAFLIQGQVVYCGHDACVEESYKGPCMLPPSPALYICGTDIKVGGYFPFAHGSTYLPRDMNISFLAACARKPRFLWELIRQRC